ncbi:lipid phosphate phosphatase 2-like [Bidens hawaiensis]|uniref:lipid phosphate phosphatase 2-like n=1 Tax=Bidens hawaiensis TaxID=980011 RepID=UPI0040498C8B
MAIAIAIQKNGQDSRVREVDLGAFYIKSHGIKLAKTHKHDWLILALLAVIEIGLNIIHPFYRFVGEDMMTDLKYPMKDNTVPVWSVPIYAVLLPIVVFSVFYYRRRDVHDLHHAILGLLFSVLITGVITDAIKDAVGRPRPDFFWRCFPDGIDNYDKWGNVICHGKDKDIREGHKSFPSGHTSCKKKFNIILMLPIDVTKCARTFNNRMILARSFAGLGFLALYMAGKIKVFDRRGHVAKLCILFLPLLMASLVAVSLLDDYWHHWQDVFAGGILGLVVATMCYLQFFPAPYHSEGWGPYAYFRALEETNSRSVDGVRLQAVEIQGLSHQSRRNGSQTFRQVSLSDSLRDVEAGKM